MENSRLVNFAANPDLSTWTQYKGGASTIVLSNGDKTATIFNDGARAFIYKDIAVVDTDWVYISAIIDSADAVFDTDSFGDAQIVTVETGVADGDQSYEITSSDDGNRVGILFQPYAGATSVRLRIGPGAATTGEAGTLVFSDVTVQQFSSEPTYVDKYYDVSGAASFPHEIYTDTDAQCIYAAGSITESVPTSRLTNDQSRILFIGDSYGLLGRYPDKVIADLDAINTTDKHYLYRDHIGGTNLTEINARLSSALDGTTFDIPTELQTPYKAVVLGTVGGNSVLDGHSSSTILSDLDSFIATTTAAGVEHIVLLNIPPFKGYPSWTQTKQDVASALRSALGSVYADCPVVDTFALLESPNQPEYLADDADHGDPYDYTNNNSSPDDGDGLHANWVPAINGNQVLADEVLSYLLAHTVGNTTLSLSPASVMSFNKNYVSVGNTTLSLSPASVMSLNKNYVSVGNTTLSLSPAPVMSFNKNYVSVGNTTLSIVTNSKSAFWTPNFTIKSTTYLEVANATKVTLSVLGAEAVTLYTK